MREDIKHQAVSVGADMLEREFALDPATAEAMTRRIMSLVLPPLEKEVDQHNASRQKALVQADYQLDRFGDTMSRMVSFIESVVEYADHIGVQRRPGHYVDVPVDDRTMRQLLGLLGEWRAMGGKASDRTSRMNLRWEERSIFDERASQEFFRRGQYVDELSNVTMENVAKAMEAVMKNDPKPPPGTSGSSKKPRRP